MGYMMTNLKTISAVSVFCFAAGQLLAQPLDSWKEVNDWNIVFNEATSGCFMEHVTPEGFVLHIGTNDAMFSGAEDERAYFVGFYAPVDSGFSSSQESNIEITSGPDAFAGTAHEIVRDGYHGWVANTNNDKLVDDLRDRKTMVVKAEGGGEALINLFELGIDEAFTEMVECQLIKG